MKAPESYLPKPKQLVQARVRAEIKDGMRQAIERLEIKSESAFIESAMAFYLEHLNTAKRRKPKGDL